MARVVELKYKPTFSRHFKPTIFLKSGGFSVATISKVRPLRCENFHTVFLPFGSVVFCLRGLGHGGAAPEARHRCIWQPGTTWTTKAVASDEGFGWGKLLEAMGSLSVEVDEMLKVQVISDVFLFCGRCFAKNIWH